MIHKISGDVIESQENTKLLKKEAIQAIKTVYLNQVQIQSICSNSGSYWVFSSNKSTFTKHYEEGVCIDEIQVNIKHCSNRPFCIVDNEGVRAVYKNDTYKLYMFKDSQQKLVIDFAPLGIACICSTSDGEILVR